MQPIDRILVAVKDPHARRQPGVEKAIHIAGTLGASIELFHALSAPVLLEIQPLTGHSLGELKREALALARKQLDKLVASAARQGVVATHAVEWDFPPHDAILRAATRFRANLIIAEFHKGRRLVPWLVHLTDWELLRLSSVPVLLMKNTKRWGRAPILAAVDPSHTHSKPSGLDREVVAEAGRLADATRAALHLVHANFPSFVGMTLGDPAMDAALLATTYQQQKDKDREDFGVFAKGAAISTARRHLMAGSPVQAIPKAARAVGASVVVMGAVSRSGLRRVFIGNTAERVLNTLPCDVFVVKAPGFTRSVASRPRGVRVAPPQPLMPMPMPM
jgi:universal stress protein E